MYNHFTVYTHLKAHTHMVPLYNGYEDMQYNKTTIKLYFISSMQLVTLPLHALYYMYNLQI